MPTYEHICGNGHEFEEFQSIVAPPIEVCPICGAPAKRKISGGSGLIFKGSGFYITDYAKKNSSAGGSHSNKPSESKSSESNTTESKTPDSSSSSSTSSTSSDSKS
ncbi:MAG: zinc ribbon domain-containing protein [bacterium]|nr:zinc ribbon domain-containing protein [bacterium]